MEVRFDLTGTTRRELVKVAEQIVGAKATYKKLPTLAYELVGFTFTKEGTLVWDEHTALEAAERLVTALTEQGFRVLTEDTEPPTEGATAVDALVTVCRRTASQTLHWQIWTGSSRRRVLLSRKRLGQTASPTR